MFVTLSRSTLLTDIYSNDVCYSLTFHSTDRHILEWCLLLCHVPLYWQIYSNDVCYSATFHSTDRHILEWCLLLCDVPLYWQTYTRMMFVTLPRSTLLTDIYSNDVCYSVTFHSTDRHILEWRLLLSHVPLYWQTYTRMMFVTLSRSTLLTDIYSNDVCYSLTFHSTDRHILEWCLLLWDVPLYWQTYTRMRFVTLSRSTLLTDIYSNDVCYSATFHSTDRHILEWCLFLCDVPLYWQTYTRMMFDTLPRSTLLTDIYSNDVCYSLTFHSTDRHILEWCLLLSDVPLYWQTYTRMMFVTLSRSTLLTDIYSNDVRYSITFHSTDRHILEWCLLLCHVPLYWQTYTRMMFVTLSRSTLLTDIYSNDVCYSLTFHSTDRHILEWCLLLSHVPLYWHTYTRMMFVTLSRSTLLTDIYSNDVCYSVTFHSTDRHILERRLLLSHVPLYWQTYTRMMFVTLSRSTLLTDIYSNDVCYSVTFHSTDRHILEWCLLLYHVPLYWQTYTRMMFVTLWRSTLLTDIYSNDVCYSLTFHSTDRHILEWCSLLYHVPLYW